MSPVLTVRNLCVRIGAEDSAPLLVRGVNLDLVPGETLTLIGESGSGKTLTSLALLHLLPQGMRLHADVLLLRERDIGRLDEPQFRELRGRRLAMIFQDPVGAFNPAKRIGWHLRAVLARADCTAEWPKGWHPHAVAALADVGITDPDGVLRRYPHQLSGGMLQRVLIAMVLALKPDVIIADEPTTNLDNIVERQILALFHDLQQRLSSALLFITHDMTIAGLISDRVAVMYAGQIVETGPAQTVLKQPLHPYTQGLIATARALEDGSDTLTEIPGQPPSTTDQEPGCAFRPRCTLARPGCELPQRLRQPDPARAVRCLLYD